MNRTAQGANELLVRLVRLVEERGVHTFTAEDAAGWFTGVYSRRYVQKILWRLKSQRKLRTVIRRPRVLLSGYRRGVENIYEVTKRGRERAAYWLESHNLLSLAYLASNRGEGSALASAIARKAVSELPLDSGDLGLLTFRSRDRNSLGFLLAALSGRYSYVFSLGRQEMDLWWSIRGLRAEGIVPSHIGTAAFMAAARIFFGSSVEQILIAILYKSSSFFKNQLEISKNQLEFFKDQLETFKNRLEIAHLRIELTRTCERFRCDRLVKEQREAYERLLTQQTYAHRFQAEMYCIKAEMYRAQIQNLLRLVNTFADVS